MSDMFRQWIRLSRSEPFGKAGEDEGKAKEYQASLQQFEELLDAALAAGPLSRPLPLFYALSQAGRAIAAARGGGEHSVHGLTLDEPRSDILHTTVRPSRPEAGQFQVVASATGSPAIKDPIPLGALMASLPELSNEFLLETTWPRALPVWPDMGPTAHLRDSEWCTVYAVFDKNVTFAEQVQEMLAAYPAVKDRIALVQAELQFAELPKTPTPSGMAIRMLVRDEGRGLDSRLPQYRVSGYRWLRPGFSDSEPPTPLMTWWLLLFGLSMLARYHPVAWTRALDPDTSPDAVSLERAMFLGIRALPQLVFEALLGSSVPIAPGIDPFE